MNEWIITVQSNGSAIRFVCGDGATEDIDRAEVYPSRRAAVQAAKQLSQADRSGAVYVPTCNIND